MGNFHPLEVVGRGSEIQLQVGDHLFNPLTAGAALYSGFHFLLAHWVPHFKYVKDKM